MMKALSKITIIALSVCLISSCGKKSSLNPNQIMGYWKTVVGENEYVQFEKVDSEYVYSAFTYDKLAASGTWEVEDDKLNITFDNGSSVQLTVNFIGDTMVFNDGAEKYIKTISPSDIHSPIEDISDIQILEQVIKNIDIVFTDIEPCSEEWLPTTTKWQKITTEVVLKRDDASQVNELSSKILGFLSERAFDVDESKVSETISAYKKGKLRVMVRTRISPEPSVGETAYVDIISGIEN